MKRYAFVLGLVCALLASCGKDDDKSKPDSDEGDYSSYWYYSYEAGRQITAEALGMASEDFIPYTVAHVGDTLFLANTGKAGNSLLVLSIKKGTLLRTVKTWQFNSVEKSFESAIEAVVPSGDRLYVAERQSRIHVFRLPELDYITCIGNGNWSGPVFQAQAMTVKDGLIFARDKNGRISVYKEKDATPENYQKVGRYRRAAGEYANNGFNTHYMQCAGEGRILLTDYEAKKFRVLNPALVNDEMTDNMSIDVDDEAMLLDFKPKTFALATGRIYATGGNNAVNVYDSELKEWCKALKSLKGFAFSQPARIYAQNDSVYWVSDVAKRTLVEMGVYKSEIREYVRLNGDSVRVVAVRTRSEEGSDFLVDVRTHEVVE